MNVHTYQIAQWRRLPKDGLVAIDTTVKSGAIQLAPTWEMVLGIKKGVLSQNDYSKQYRALLDYWWFQDPAFFDELLALPDVAFGCYCKPGVFCHRHLLVNFLAEVTVINYLGEL